MKPRRQCARVGGRVQPCGPLFEALDPDGLVGRRLVVQQLMRADGMRTRQLVTLYSGDHRRNGITLECCPFCGRPLHGRVGKRRENAT